MSYPDMHRGAVAGMTRDELEALLWDVLGINARPMLIETILLAVDSHVDHMIDLTFCESGGQP